MTDARDLIRGYAAAIFQIAEAEGNLEVLSDQLFHFAKVLERSHELRTTLTDIAIPTERKAAVIEDLLGDRASALTRNVIEFVVAQGHARELDAIVEDLAGLAAERRSKVLGEVRSAIPLSEEQRQRLNEALSKATGKTVDVKVIVDPSVVGGIFAKVGDQVIDATVRKRLQDLKESIGG
ncbi:MAG: ATP synthase F1 subunit delta [Actinomycetota bacterium]